MEGLVTQKSILDNGCMAFCTSPQPRNEPLTPEFKESALQFGA